ncbi:tRNA (N6-threonylcarbamoyladenosine(37)-N6)-methyltransferase TrmO [Zobellella endophytica]|uniref:tRNA (N6-threonylcarbamoyladenosine(37)-N6)-methyltransferase TrmO n=1 Tax=Zobellella endophytica TaxID=2116700 RepID=A0A2P7R7A1_9GAMM|nr:tRNA (N6-threonylcarbamoyladenosine(37)-N6)-methyltransferase TrmO [Zobellella endophytica]PSJ46094.1 tRNA (N6-threonylcarbamoyladenosine(37)-N6)-methyltransferase TrmO [Zobellella endophytica]
MEPVTLDPIGIIRSPYKEKFAVPRQPGLVTRARARLEMLPPYNEPSAFRGLAEFSHLWLVFVFHQTRAQGWNPTVRPPRLGGNERIGVFATRSTFRPNPIGLSVVELHEMCRDGNKVWLELGGVDLVDGTPVLDIKPYLPWADAVPEAHGGFAPAPPDISMEVIFSPAAELACARSAVPELKEFISEVLVQDPRPAYKRGGQSWQQYGVRLHHYNVRYEVFGQLTRVLAIEPEHDGGTSA